MSDAVWISEQDVVGLMHLGEAIDALERGLALQADGKAANMVKTHLAWGGGHTLHAIGAAVEGAGLVGTKTWAHTAGGATPLLVLWNAESGALVAIIEAFALGQMRTGAMSGLATRLMAAEDADVLAIIGSGKQATAQVAAVAAVRPLQRVQVFSPTAEKRTAFCAKLTEAGFADEVVDCENLEDAISGASIVTLATRAKESFLSADLLQAGAHINAIGAITPEREEFTQDVFDRCGAIAVDDVAAVRKLSREFIQRFGDDDGAWQAVRPVCELIGADRAAAGNGDGSLFKAMGMGISDLALGGEILRRASEASVGRAVPQPQKIQPRLRA